MTPEELKPNKSIIAKSLSGGVSTRGDLILVKFRDIGDKRHVVFIISTLVHWCGKHMQPLTHGPYVASEDEEITPQDWEGKTAIVLTSLICHQNTDDSLVITSNAQNKFKYQFTLLPACHAEFQSFATQARPYLIDMQSQPPTGLAN